MLQPGAMINAKYEVTRQIGQGGMSTVYQARDCATGKLLAVKDIERNGRENDQVVVQSLSTEGRMLKQLDNPHLPKIYDIIEDSSSFMLVMDYIEGESLDKVLAKAGAQDPQIVYNWGMQICEVFDYLHRQTPPIIYRDMKPANVILQPDGNIMMIDFGTARTQKGSQLLQSDTICIGTEGFAAPEQFGGMGESDARTDIFCLGATLYNMVTGHSPSVYPKGILPLEKWNPNLADSPLTYIIEKCTRNDPNERYQTAMELHEDLRQASTGAFRSASQKRGKSGPLSGGLRKVGWQQQNLRTPAGVTGTLAGLLNQSGKSGKIGKTDTDLEKKTTANTASTTAAAAGTKPDDAGWIKNNTMEEAKATPRIPEPQTVQSVVPGDDAAIWQKVMIISAIAAAVLMLIGIICYVAGSEAAAVVMMVFAFAAIALAVIGIINVMKTNAVENTPLQ